MSKAFKKFESVVERNNSILCVGIDPDENKINEIYGNGLEAIKDFCFDLIESTKDFAAAFKINFAFFEQFGSRGFELIEIVKGKIPDHIFTIADAKRGDIGNTAKAYARSIFEYFDFDSVTVNPYMGSDSIEPFLEWKDKLTIILALTSNPGSSELQLKKIDNEEIFLKIAGTFGALKGYNIGFVFGATRSEYIYQARELSKGKLFLVPGVGSQGGDSKEVLKANDDNPILINVSRAISYPIPKDEQTSRKDLMSKVTQKAREYQAKFNEERAQRKGLS